MDGLVPVFDDKEDIPYAADLEYNIGCGAFTVLQVILLVMFSRMTITY